MFIFYLIISILWGVLIFLHSFKELGYVVSIIFTIATIFIWPVFIPISIVIEIVNLSKEKKVYGETCIPYGTYKVVINKSPKFKRLMPRLLDVPHFDGILIHSGNTEKDSAGCIILG